MTSRRRAESRPARPADAPAYLSKAREYLRAATDSLDLGNRVAATGNAIHAGICAADAIAALQAGAVWKGEHSQAAQFLEKSAKPDGPQAARHLARLIRLKGNAEYDPDPIPHDEARGAVEAARRIFAIAEQAIARMTD